MPKNSIEYGFYVITLILSAILNALIFGDIAGLVLKLSIEEIEIQNINDRNNEVMNEINLPGEVADTIRIFF